MLNLILSLAVVLQARERVEQQQGLVRGPAATAGELADAVEPGEQCVSVEPTRASWMIGWFTRHRARMRSPEPRAQGRRCKCLHWTARRPFE